MTFAVALRPAQEAFATGDFDYLEVFVADILLYLI